MEFLGYRILYLLFSRNRAGECSPQRLRRSVGGQLTSSAPAPADLNTTLAELTPDEYQNDSVKHALAVRLATSQGNYTKLFRLFVDAPKMGAYVMDHFVNRERVSALVTMSRA